jgi:hypothetical protein
VAAEAAHLQHPVEVLRQQLRALEQLQQQQQQRQRQQRQRQQRQPWMAVAPREAAAQVRCWMCTATRLLLLDGSILVSPRGVLCCHVRVPSPWGLTQSMAVMADCFGPHEPCLAPCGWASGPTLVKR